MPMSGWDLLDRLPAEFETLEGSLGRLAVRSSVRRELLAAGFGPDAGEQLAASDLSGRTRLDELPLEDGSRAVVRRFTHGGLLRVVTGERYADPRRPFEELLLSERLRSLEIPVAEVLAARAVRARPFGWRLALVTRRLERRADLAVLFEARRAREGTRAGWAELVYETGRIVGRFHAVGFLHADLHPRNLLFDAEALEGAAPDPVGIDLDRSRFLTSLRPSVRRRNLARFWRAVAKREQRGAPFLTRSDVLRFFRGYDQGLGRASGLGAWKQDWRRVRSYVGAVGWIHTLGWRLERLLGRGPEARDGAAVVRDPGASGTPQD